MKRLSTFKHLFSNSIKLTDNEQKILEYINSNPIEFCKSSVSNLAKSIGVSQPAITRFVKRYDFDSISNLKYLVSKEIGTVSQDNTKSYHGNITKKDTIESIYNKIITENIIALRRLQDTANASEIENALTILERSQEVVFFGIGGSSSVALDAYYKFIKTDKKVDYVSDIHLLLMLTSKSCVNVTFVVVSHDGSNKTVNVALKRARENGATVIAITNKKTSSLGRLAEAAIVTTSSEYQLEEHFETVWNRVVTYSVIDVLFMSYIIGNQKEVNENVQSMRLYLKEFKEK